MNGPGVRIPQKVCLYCGKPIVSHERVAMCARCNAAHHESCWDRNGRCSTFQCWGQPEIIIGAELADWLRNRQADGMRALCECRYCNGEVVPGYLQARNLRRRGWAKPNWLPPAGSNLTGLVFRSGETAPRFTLRLSVPLIRRIFGNRDYLLPGARITAQSCAQCKRLYLKGITVDSDFFERYAINAAPRDCPNCGNPLTKGSILLRPSRNGATFICDKPPNLHHDVLGHLLIDSIFYRRWNPNSPALPAFLCTQCYYCEVAEFPFYRAMG